MTRFIVVVLWTLQAACGAVPRLFQEKEFTSGSFAEAVNHFIAMGEDAAIKELQVLAAGEDTNTKRGFSLNERVGWMCRVLFEPKAANLRPPSFGALDLPYHSMPSESWPLYPVALSGSTYFVFSEGYSCGGLPEVSRAYIAYCRQAGVFRKKPIHVPSIILARLDADALRCSAAWKAIKWKDSGENWSYTMDELRAWEFIQKQADAFW